MAEKFTLTTPETKPSNSYYDIERLTLDWLGASILIELKGENGERKVVGYFDTQATNMMIFLNKANLSIKSLQRRIFEQLEADGHLVGTIEGEPD